MSNGSRQASRDVYLSKAGTDTPAARQAAEASKISLSVGPFTVAAEDAESV
jgi:hypothetical protein